MILLIDNYDSFSYNLCQLIGGIRPDIQVIRHDERTVEEIRTLAPDHLILSPGPGRPAFRMIYSVDNIILCIILFVNTLLKINNYDWVNCLKSGRAFWLHDKKHRSLRPVFFLNV